MCDNYFNNKIFKFCFVINLLFLILILSISIIKSVNASETMIYIDPGHGGLDGGCIDNSGFYEKDIVLDISYKLKEFLELNGYKVLMTRSGDYDLAGPNSYNRKHDDILKRVKNVNESNASLCVSIHANTFPNSLVRGAQVFYGIGNDESKYLSEIIQNKIESNIKDINRDAMLIKNKYLLDNINIPSVIVEVGFMSNKEENTLLKSSTYQKIMAYAIGEGIIEFLSKK